MKKLLIAASFSAVTAGAFADEAPASPHQFSGTATITSDYVFRGLTQTWGQPAIQGSIDYAHASGFYGSLWASTMSDKVVAGSDFEIDLALGFRGAVNEQLGYGAGLITVYYPGGNYNKMKWGERPDERYDFTEAHVFLGYRWVTLKYSQTLNDLMGFNEKTGFSKSTKGATYVELNADIPLMETGVVLGLHAGRQDLKATAGGINPNFTDYRVSLSKTFAESWSASVQVSENNNAAFFNGTRSNQNENDARDVGKRRYAVTLTRLF